MQNCLMKYLLIISILILSACSDAYHCRKCQRPIVSDTVYHDSTLIVPVTVVTQKDSICYVMRHKDTTIVTRQLILDIKGSNIKAISRIDTIFQKVPVLIHYPTQTVIVRSPQDVITIRNQKIIAYGLGVLSLSLLICLLLILLKWR